jgi:hypothetical protein
MEFPSIAVVDGKVRMGRLLQLRPGPQFQLDLPRDNLAFAHFPPRADPFRPNGLQPAPERLPGAEMAPPAPWNSG